MDKNIQSYYNEGYFQIQRLNMLKIEANNAAKHGDFDKWRWILDNIWRELAADIIKSSNFEIYDKIMREKDQYFKKHAEFQREIRESKTDGTKLYSALSDYEIFLRSVQEKFGKGGKHIDPSERSMD